MNFIVALAMDISYIGAVNLAGDDYAELFGKACHQRELGINGHLHGNRWYKYIYSLVFLVTFSARSCKRSAIWTLLTTNIISFLDNRTITHHQFTDLENWQSIHNGSLKHVFEHHLLSLVVSTRHPSFCLFFLLSRQVSSQVLAHWHE